MRTTLSLLLILAGGGEAAAVPRCAPRSEGAVACLDGKLCECRHHPGGSVVDRPAGVRWDCGALRPSCGAAAPPTLDGGQVQQPLPTLPAPWPPPWR